MKLRHSEASLGVCPDVLVLLNDECDWIQINQLSEFDLSLVFFI